MGRSGRYAAMRGGRVYTFDVPASHLDHATVLVDSLQKTTSSAKEYRSHGELSFKLNEFLRPPK